MSISAIQTRLVVRKDFFQKLSLSTPVFLLGKIPWTEEPVHGISESQTQLKQLITHAYNTTAV